jgi:hypothetical protein
MANKRYRERGLRLGKRTPRQIKKQRESAEKQYAPHKNEMRLRCE